jgi:DNA-binding IclR family transcriptional regulator
MTVAAVDRCIRLIELLAATPDGCTVTDLAAALASPKSAVHRMLATLAARGYVVQDARSQTYAG